MQNNSIEMTNLRSYPLPPRTPSHSRQQASSSSSMQQQQQPPTVPMHMVPIPMPMVIDQQPQSQLHGLPLPPPLPQRHHHHQHQPQRQHQNQQQLLQQQQQPLSLPLPQPQLHQLPSMYVPPPPGFQQTSFTTVPMEEIIPPMVMMPMYGRTEYPVITQQPTHSQNPPFGPGQVPQVLQVGQPLDVPIPPPPSLPPEPTSSSSQSQGRGSATPRQIGIPLPGMNLLDRIPTFKIHSIGTVEGHSTCSPGYRVYNLEDELVLNGISDTLFCPFDSKMKNIYLSDTNNDCILEIKFTPSICECDSEEKRCFAVFSPCFSNPFGAIIFESGQLKHSMKILNALEGETFAVHFLSSRDLSIKGADGTVVAIINVNGKRGESQKYTLNLMEEVSSTNKALFISCAITMHLVSCETTCTRLICFSVMFLALASIVGLSFGSTGISTKDKNG